MEKPLKVSCCVVSAPLLDSQQLSGLSPELLELLQQYRFDRSRFRQLAERVTATDDNCVSGVLSAPSTDEIGPLPPDRRERERLSEIGREALRQGRVALVLLAGGMATRMGGVVKALVEALPGRTFLGLRLEEIDSVERRYGRAPPVWLMTSHNTDAALRGALGERLDGDRVATFCQSLSLRLTPSGQLYLDTEGQPSLYAPGHGDLPEALRQSGLLTRFVERGGQVVMVANIDNLGGTLDATLIGWHLAHGAPITAEVVEKMDGDRGGIPVRVNGRTCILEEFRIPPSFDPASVRVFNTNTFHFDAKVLDRLDIPWTYFKVSKKVDGQPVIQFERLVNETTSFLPSRYLLVPRDGAESRFLPVKDNAELARRRTEIETVARARGML